MIHHTQNHQKKKKINEEKTDKVWYGQLINHLGVFHMHIYTCKIYVYIHKHTHK